MRRHTGYAAVTQDNGCMIILEGGSTYMLQHRNHKFEMFISQKIQTDELRGIKCASADNVVIAVQATVNWRIIDVETAARMAADTMLQGGGQGKHKGNRYEEGSDDVHVNSSGALDLGKLRDDVLKQAEASLSAFIALVNYSDTFGVSATVTHAEHHAPKPTIVATAVPVPNGGGSKGATPPSPPKSAALFDLTKLQSMVGHANEVTQIYGVQIGSINIIQAFPANEKLMASLAKGAVAAAEAQQMR